MRPKALRAVRSGNAARRAARAARDDRNDDEVRDAPPVVVTAVSLGTVPLPFLGVYAILFVLHGWLSPVHPPDITNSQNGELIAGLIAAAAFVAITVTLLWFLNRRRRWPFVVAELVVAGVAAWFLSDDTKGGPVVSAVVLVATLAAVVLGFAPAAWQYLDQSVPTWLRQLPGMRPRPDTTAQPPAAGDPALLPTSTEPSTVEPSSLRRRRSSSSR